MAILRAASDYEPPQWGRGSVDPQSYKLIHRPHQEVAAEMPPAEALQWIVIIFSDPTANAQALSARLRRARSDGDAVVRAAEHEQVHLLHPHTDR